MPTRVLHASRWPWFIVGATAVSFVISGVLSVRSGWSWGWFAILFFGVGIVATVAEIVRPRRLELTP